MYDKLLGLRVGFAVCGSFCTFDKAFEQARILVELGCIVTPIMSFNARNLTTRFGSAQENCDKLERICGNRVLAELPEVEPIGPKNMLDIVVVAPCTGNTLAKLAMGITDTPVTMAVKSHLRNLKPIIIAISTNDAASGSAKNIGLLENYKNYYFVPFYQDDSNTKPNSMMAHFELIPATIEACLEGRQLQPVYRV